MIKTQHCPNCETHAREAERWRVRADQHNDECERMGVNGQAIIDQLCYDNKRLQAEAQARYDRGYYDGFTRPLEQSDALRDQLLRECLVKLRDVQGTEAPKQYACNLIKRIERVLQGQSK